MNHMIRLANVQPDPIELGTFKIYFCNLFFQPMYVTNIVFLYSFSNDPPSSPLTWLWKYDTLNLREPAKNIIRGRSQNLAAFGHKVLTPSNLGKKVMNQILFNTLDPP